MTLPGMTALGRALRVCGSATLMLALAVPPSIAENNGALLEFWRNIPRKTQPAPPRSRPPAPRPPRTVEVRAADPRPAKPRTKPEFTVAVFGDAFGASLARGLGDAYAGKPTMLVDDRTGDDLDLTRKDRAAWAAIIDRARAQLGAIDIAAVMLGGNDLDPLPNAQGQDAEPGSAAWRTLYGDRAEALAVAFRERRIPVIWVGLPIVRDDDEAKLFADINAVVRERVPKAGAVFIDAWEAFASDSGQYSLNGPDVDGQDAKLRRNDGWGFTRAGARKLASFVESGIKREQDRSASTRQLSAVRIENPTTFDQALQIDINAQIRREAGLAPAGGQSPADPQPGPVQDLTAAPVASNGLLAPQKPGRPAPAFADTRIVQAKAGRTDDFAWPRP